MERFDCRGHHSIDEYSGYETITMPEVVSAAKIIVEALTSNNSYVSTNGINVPEHYNTDEKAVFIITILTLLQPTEYNLVELPNKQLLLQWEL